MRWCRQNADTADAAPRTGEGCGGWGKGESAVVVFKHGDFCGEDGAMFVGDLVSGGGKRYQC